MKIFSICVPDEIKERMTKGAEAEGVSRNSYVVNKILEGMNSEFVISALILLLKKNGTTEQEINEMLKV